MIQKCQKWVLQIAVVGLQLYEKRYKMPQHDRISVATNLFLLCEDHFSADDFKLII